MKKYLLIAVMLLLSGANKLAGFNPATHMYLGMTDEAISFWEAFGDPAFANALRGWMYGEDALLVKKFYL